MELARLPALLLSYRGGFFTGQTSRKRNAMDSLGSPTLNTQRSISMTEHSTIVDATAELTAPPPDSAPRPAPLPQVAALTSPELIRQLEALAREVAVSGRDSFDHCIEKVQEGTDYSAAAAEPPLCVSSRDRFVSLLPPVGKRSLTLASFFIAALIGIGAIFAWQLQAVSTTKSPVQAALPPQPAPVAQTAAASAAPTSPELAQQLEGMARDLADLKHSVEQLAAKQVQLEQVAAAQQELAAKQEQLAQTIASLQSTGLAIKHRISPSALSRTIPISPRRNIPANARPASTDAPPAPPVVTNAPPESAAQTLSEPRPVPPLPVPPDFR